MSLRKGSRILASMKRENETGLLEMRDAIPDAGKILYLSPEDQRRVAEAILNPPEPVEALVRAFERHWRIVVPETHLFHSVKK